MSSNTVQSGVLTEIRQGQVSTLFRKTSLGFWGNLILATIYSAFFIYLRPEFSNGDAGSDNKLSYLIIWLVLLVSVCLYRKHVTNQFDPNEHRDASQLVLWANKYILLTTIINTIWGVSGLILVYNAIGNHFLIVCVLFSVLMISIPVLAISKFAFNIQVVAVLTPILINLFQYYLIKSPLTLIDYPLIPMGVLILAGTMLAVSGYIHRMLMELRDSQTSLRKQANTDTLTQISNRRYFDQTFKNEWRRTTRDGIPISMLLIDIDFFKDYNDKQGQRAGDNCLKSIASCMEVVTRRPADLAARYGGEEFAVLLPNTTMENAVMLGEKLRTKVESLQIPHPTSEYNVITVSVGVSCCITPELDDDKADDEKAEVMYPAMLMNAADNAMFLAKQQGRNRVAEQKCGEQRLAQVLQKYAAKEASRT